MGRFGKLGERVNEIVVVIDFIDDFSCTIFVCGLAKKLREVWRFT